MLALMQKCNMQNNNLDFKETITIFEGKIIMIVIRHENDLTFLPCLSL